MCWINKVKLNGTENAPISLLWNLRIKYIWSKTIRLKLWCSVFASSKYLIYAHTQTRIHTHMTDRQTDVCDSHWKSGYTQACFNVRQRITEKEWTTQGHFVLFLIMRVKISKGIPLCFWDWDRVSFPIVPPLCYCLPILLYIQSAAYSISYFSPSKIFEMGNTIVKSEEAFSKSTDDYCLCLTESDEFVLLSTAFWTESEKKGQCNSQFYSNQKPTFVEYAPERKAQQYMQQKVTLSNGSKSIYSERYDW